MRKAGVVFGVLVLALLSAIAWAAIDARVSARRETMTQAAIALGDGGVIEDLSHETRARLELLGWPADEMQTFDFVVRRYGRLRVATDPVAEFGDCVIQWRLILDSLRAGDLPRARAAQRTLADAVTASENEREQRIRAAHEAEAERAAVAAAEAEARRKKDEQVRAEQAAADAKAARVEADRRRALREVEAAKVAAERTRVAAVAEAATLAAARREVGGTGSSTTDEFSIDLRRWRVELQPTSAADASFEVLDSSGAVVGRGRNVEYFRHARVEGTGRFRVRVNCAGAWRLLIGAEDEQSQAIVVAAAVRAALRREVSGSDTSTSVEFPVAHKAWRVTLEPGCSPGTRYEVLNVLDEVVGRGQDLPALWTARVSGEGVYRVRVRSASAWKLTVEPE